jgi:hypothetical protein
MQDDSRNSPLNLAPPPLNRSTPSSQTFTPQTGLVQNHAPVIKSSSFGVPINSQDFSRQAVTPNMLATPNAVVPQQVNRSLTTPPPAMPTYQKSQALKEMQPQLFKPK